MRNHQFILDIDPPVLPDDVKPLYYVIEVCAETGVCSEDISGSQPVTITSVARGAKYSYSAKVKSLI